MSFADHVTAADRAAQVHLGGEVVIYAPAVGDAVTIRGMFDDAYVRVDPGIGGGGEQVAPALFVLLADLPADPDEDDPTITISAKQYRVIERQADGLGGVRLILQRSD